MSPGSAVGMELLARDELLVNSGPLSSVSELRSEDDTLQSVCL